MWYKVKNFLNSLCPAKHDKHIRLVSLFLTAFWALFITTTTLNKKVGEVLPLWPTTLFFLSMSALLLIYHFFLSGLCKPANEETIEDLREELDRSKNANREYVEHLSSKTNEILSDMSEDFDLDGKDRITLFKHVHDFLVPFGRFCIHSGEEEFNRTFYPENQGCIGDALVNGKSIETDMPKYENEPETYKEKQKEWAIPPDITDRLIMKPRSIGAFSIKDDYNHHIGVIVFESHHPEGIGKNLKDYGDIHKEIFESEDNDYLSRLKNLLTEGGVRADFARGRGF